MDSEGNAVFPPGDGETGGTAGSGGSSGTGGEGGTAGSAGTAGGAAGSPGTGGTAGSTAGSSGTGGTAGSSGTGGGPGGAAGSAGSSDGSGGSPGPEDCLNGNDDNGNGLVDCADPGCQPDYTCVPASPAGWSAPGFRADRAAAAAAVDCGSLEDAGLTLLHELQTPDSGCTCGCGDPEGASCSVSASLWENGNCSGGSATVPDGCFGLNNAWRIGGVDTGNATIATPDSCEALVDGTPAAPSFERAADFCIAPQLGGGCDASQVCVPSPGASLLEGACVEQAGEVACPAAFPNQHVFHEDFDDTRSCTVGGCSCDPATGQTCEAYVSLYENKSCNGQPKGEYAIDGTCHATGFDYGDMGSAQFTGSISGGSCPASGSAGIDGSVEPTGAHTLCCVP